jgi:hypothetical protein
VRIQSLESKRCVYRRNGLFLSPSVSSPAAVAGVPSCKTIIIRVREALLKQRARLQDRPPSELAEEPVLPQADRRQRRRDPAALGSSKAALAAQPSAKAAPDSEASRRGVVAR